MVWPEIVRRAVRSMDGGSLLFIASRFAIREEVVAPVNERQSKALVQANGGPHVGAYDGSVVTGLYIDNELGIGSTIKDSAGVS